MTKNLIIKVFLTVLQHNCLIAKALNYKLEKYLVLQRK